ncbi:MAG: hypothetical protein FWC57_04785 [Endomicrobia bacterium]|nr:hypothetical protein [Endomicrobiia bacterium]
MKNKTLILKSLFILFSAMFICVAALNIFNYPMAHYDDALYADVSKNLAFGYGYASGLNEACLARFNPNIGTGPAVILPAALVIKIFGNKYWAPGLSAALLNFVLLFFIFWLPKKFNAAADEILWLWRVVFIIVLFFASTLPGLEQWACFNQMYASMFGEAPAALLIIVSAIVLIYARQTALNFFVSGVLGGLAVKSKLLSAMHVFAVVFFVFVWHYKNGMGLNQNAKKLILYFAGLMLPYIMFDIYKLIDLGSFRSYAAMKFNESNFVVNIHSGLGNSLNDGIAENSIINIKFFIKNFGIHGFALGVCVVLYCVKNLFGKTHDNKNRLFSDALLFAFACNFVWHISINPTVLTRYLFIGWVLFLTAACYYILSVSGLKQKILYFLIILVILLTALNPAAEAIRHFDFAFDNTLAKDMRQVEDFMSSNKQYNYFACGWWVPWEIEYLLPAADNFKNTVEVAQFNALSNRALVRSKMFFGSEENAQVNEEIKNLADKNKLFENEYYVISKLDDNYKISDELKYRLTYYANNCPAKLKTEFPDLNIKVIKSRKDNKMLLKITAAGDQGLNGGSETK